MLCCDLIVAGNTAFFGIPEVKRGLVAAGGGLLRMPQQMPQRIAMELALTGDYINADRALEMGLINRSVEPGSALQEARQLADKIAANGPLAVAKSKEVMVNSLDWGSDEMFAKQMEVRGSGVYQPGCHRRRNGLRREARTALDWQIETNNPGAKTGT